MTEFTPIYSFGGGLLIGLAVVALMYFWGRIAGMTGILGGILPPFNRDGLWKLTYLGGAISAPFLLQLFGPQIEYEVPVSLTSLIAGGLITGIGVTIGSGCTSGHGICGMARFSKRSIAATATFMAFAFVTVFIIRHLAGGVI